MTDKKIIKFATSFRSGMLGRNKSLKRCYMVCAPLATLMCMNGIACKLVEGEICGNGVYCNHFWIELADGRVLDPTADQFNKFKGFPGMPKVYLGPPTMIHRNGGNMQPSGHLGQDGL